MCPKARFSYFVSEYFGDTPTHDEMESSPQIVVAFKFPSDLAARLDAIARSEGVTRAGIARRMVLRELARAEQPGHGKRLSGPSGPCGGRGMAGTPKSHVIGEPRKK